MYVVASQIFALTQTQTEERPLKCGTLQNLKFNLNYEQSQSETPWLISSS